MKPLSPAKMRHMHRLAVICEGYMCNRPLAEIADELGSTVASVKVTACVNGWSRTPLEAAAFRRGFAVPDEVQAEYRRLKRKKFRAHEIGQILGLHHVDAGAA